MSDAVETMFSVKLASWHNKGEILADHPTSAEAIKAAGLDWPVELRPVYWGRQAGDTWNPELVPNRKAIVRVRTTYEPDVTMSTMLPAGTEEDLLSIVSDGYKPLQNTEAFSFFDPLVQSGDLVYETAGSLFDGRKIWVLARYLRKQIRIMDTDEVRPYVLLLNGHDGVTGVTIQPTPIRVVCNNTLMASLGHGLTINFKHVGDVAGEIESAKNALESMRVSFEELDMLYSHMAEIHVRKDEIDAIIRDVCCPTDWRDTLTEQPDEEMIQKQGELSPRKRQRLDLMEAKVRDLIRNGQGANADLYGTVWGVYNALVEFAEYYLGARSKDRANFQLLGEGARFKQNALQVCQRMVDGRLEAQSEPAMPYLETDPF